MVKKELVYGNAKKILLLIVIVLLVIGTVAIDYVGNSRENKGNIQSISTSYFNSCYVTNEGQLFVTGLNLNKTYSDDTVLSSPVMIHTASKVVKAVASLNAILYYDEYGDMYMLGMVGMENGEPKYSSEPVRMSNVKNVVDIEAGEMHYMALDIDGNVWVWGKNNSNQVSSESSVSYINMPVKKDDLKNIIGIECGYYTSCAYTNDSIMLWGEDGCGLTGESVFLDMYVIELQETQQISIGRNHMIIQANGELWGYGSNCFGQMGQIENDFLYGESLDIEVTQDLKISCGYTCSVFCINGKVYYLGDINPFCKGEGKGVNVLTELNTEFKEIVDVDIKAFHLVYTSKEGIYYVGDNTYGQCGTTVINIEENMNQEDCENLVAVLDTGFDTNNITLMSALCGMEEKYKNNVSNIIYVDSGNITVMLPGNRLATMSGNSIAASIVSNIIIEHMWLFDDITVRTILESNLFGQK